MQTYYLLALIFIITLICVTWLLNHVPPRLLGNFDSVQRHSPLDGLRGILALSVFTHHYFKNYFFHTSGRWQSPAIDFFTNLGAVPVSLFFMITGYLFFGKVLQGKINWSQLLRSRIQRIMPLYLFLGICIVLVYLGQNHPAISAVAWLKWIERWLTFNNQSLEGFYAWPLVAGAAWTLLYEWGFYLSLPIIYIIIHRTVPKSLLQAAGILLCGCLLIYIFNHTIPRLYWLFLLAFIAVWWAEYWQSLLTRYTTLFNLIMPCLAVFILFKTQAYSYTQMLLCTVLFLFLANGYSFRQVLYHTGLKILGDLSYSLYLTHGLMIYLCFDILHLMDFHQPITHYFLVYPIVFMLAVSFACFCYLYIEKPFIHKKRMHTSSNTLNGSP